MRTILLDAPEKQSYFNFNATKYLETFNLLLLDFKRYMMWECCNHTFMELDPDDPPPPIPSFTEEVPLCTQRVTLHKISLVKNLWKDSVSF